MKTTHLLFLLSLFCLPDVMISTMIIPKWIHQRLPGHRRPIYPDRSDQNPQICLRYGRRTSYPILCTGLLWTLCLQDPNGPFENIYTARHPDKGDASYTMKAINGKPYYFYTLSYKKGFQTIQTPTVWLSPDHNLHNKRLPKRHKQVIPMRNIYRTVLSQTK